MKVVQIRTNNESAPCPVEYYVRWHSNASIFPESSLWGGDIALARLSKSYTHHHMLINYEGETSQHIEQFLIYLHEMWCDS